MNDISDGPWIFYQNMVACYKYRLAANYRHMLPEQFQGIKIHNEYFDILARELFVNPGYCWDGPSGPTFDTADNLRASLVHDVMYQCIRIGVLDDTFYSVANKEFYRILREDGMSYFRANYYYLGVKMFGKDWNEVEIKREKNDKTVHRAP